MTEKQKILVTSALPYANGPLHLGHLAGAYLPADIFVRYHRLKGNDIIYICGSDEHGVPITITADKEGITPQEVVDRYHKIINENFEKFGMSFDNYSRTSLPIHHKTAQDFFLKLKEKEFLEKKTVQQLYCETDMRFLADRYIEGTCHHCGKPGAKGDQCEACGKPIDPVLLINPTCMVCGNTPVVKDTSQWFLSLSKMQPKLEKWFRSKEGWKENVVNFCNGILQEGLQDRAVTRELQWGIKLPLDDEEGKVIYVWFEAVLGYISSTKEWAKKIGEPDKWKEYWCEDNTRLIHFIGKDNIFFHALLFPAMLMEYGGYVLQDNVPANEFLNLEGLKFSTSRDYAVWLHEYLNIFPPDPMRYCLANVAPENRDADFTWKDFQARNNNELADILGNFVNRTLAFAQRFFDSKVPVRNDLDDLDKEMLKVIFGAPNKIGECLETFRVKDGIRQFMDVARAANKYFNDKEPWRTRIEAEEKCETTINICLQVVKVLAVLMHPFVPFSSEKLWNMLRLEGRVNDASWNDAGTNFIEGGHLLGTPEILFEKIPDEVIDEQIANLREATKLKTGEVEQLTSSTISIDEFRKIDLRVAKVERAEKVEGTDKLIKIFIDIGIERRQIVAGIGKYTTPENLAGKNIIVVANLEPAKIRGIESQGMLLAAEKDDKLVLLTTDGEMECGAKVS